MLAHHVFQRGAEIERRIVAAQPQCKLPRGVVEHQRGGESGFLARGEIALGQRCAVEVRELVDAPDVDGDDVEMGRVYLAMSGSPKFTSIRRWQ